MSSFGSLQNLCMYSLGPSLSGASSKNLESQITGLQYMPDNQVNQAIYLGTNAMIAKTDGALQNIKIAQEFLGTTLTALQTVNEGLVHASKAVLTLLNGVVSDADKSAAVDGILNIMGMIENPTSRDAQEGNIVKTLRQAGTGQSPFYTLTTTQGTPATPDAAPPSAPIGGTTASASSPMYFNGSGSVPATTFCPPETVKVTGFTAQDAGPITNVAIVDSTGAEPADLTTPVMFQAEIGGKTFSSEGIDFSTVPTHTAVNMYHPEDRSKYITVYTASDVTGLSDVATTKAALSALLTGTIDGEAKTAGASGTFTSGNGGTAPAAGTFADPATSPPQFSGVEPAGAIEVLSATCSTGQFALQVGEHVYATDPSDVLDMTTVADGSAPRVLYLNGNASNAQTVTLSYEPDFTTNANAFTDDAGTLTAFKAYVSGTYTAGSGATTSPVFRHDGTASPTGAMLPCNPACFENVPEGSISDIKVTFDTTASSGSADGTKVQISVNVGENTFSTETAGADVMAAGGTVVLYKDGDNTAAEKITLRTGPIASDVGGTGTPPSSPTGIVDDATLLAEVTAALSGSYALPGASSGGVAVPFAFNPGSNLGAGYFNVSHDGAHLSISDQFGQQVGSYPLDDREVMAAASGSGEVKVGSLGTLYVDSSYEGGGFSYDLVNTPSDSFKAVVTVSASDGTRYIELPNLTDQKILWGSNTTIDRNMLLRDISYQQKVKGMIDHAVDVITETIQYASNVLSVINNDEEGQNATMESLSNLKDTVSKADPVQTAQAVFASTQKYLKMIQSMQITAQVMAQETVAANQIANLAAAGA